jgi:hypothetical protein
MEGKSTQAMIRPLEPGEDQIKDRPAHSYEFKPCYQVRGFPTWVYTWLPFHVLLRVPGLTQ